jgi:TonB-dependent starch-binding outer membrane protein SusC
MKLTAWEHFPYPVRKAWRIMRITTLLILVISLHLCASTTAQKITLASDNISIEQFFTQLEKQTGYSFLLENGVVSKDEKISVNVKNASLETVLDQILKPINLSYKIENKIVYILKSHQTSIIVEENLSLPPIDIHGRVTDSLGNPLSGASVTVKGSERGTSTDVNGNFVLTGVKENSTLSISYTGYETRQYKLKGNNEVIVKLKQAVTSLLDVTVSKGYYNTTQRYNTGNVSIVSGEDIQKQPVSDPILALEGRVPGLYIQQSSGVPGAYSSITIRGINSIANGNDPLYIIDGVPISSLTLTNDVVGGGAVGSPYPNAVANVNIGGSGAGGNGLGLSPFNALNPADIESIEVLKDADATAIYGSRGANGVVLITTKRGKVGKTYFDLNVFTGSGKVTRMMDLLNTQQYMAMRHEAFYNDSVYEPADYYPPATNYDYDLTGIWDSTRYTNWQKVLIGNMANFTNVQGNLSGGNANTQFLIGAGYSNQGTVYPGNYSDQKASVHFNLTHASEDQRFHAQFTAGYVYDNSDIPTADFTQQITLAPDAPPIYDANGNINWQVVNGTSTFQNPLASTVQHAKANSDNLISHLQLGYKILPGLEIKSGFGYNHDQMNQSILNPANSNPPPYTIYSRSSNFATTNLNTWIIEPQIDFKKKIGMGQLDALLGATLQGNARNTLSYETGGYTSDALITDPQAASIFVLGNANDVLYRYEALYSRISYNWEEKYLINLTARRDGSSRFGPGKQFGNFGAIGAGWIFSKEKFIQNGLPFFSFGKIRGSYGTSGNDQITDYQYLSTYSPTSPTYQGLSGLSPTRLTNPYFAWEVVKKLEGAIELGFLKDRILFTGSYYRDRTDNQLVGYPLPLVTGFNSVQFNLPATLQNTGIELTLNTINIRARDFTWTTSANLTIPNNKLLSYPNLASSDYAGVYVVGKSIFIGEMYHFTGVNPQTGIYRFETKNSNGFPSSPQDQFPTEPITQKFYGGIGNSITYKGFQLDVFIQFVNQLGYNYQKYFNPPGNFNDNEPTAVLGRWQSPGMMTKIQRFGETVDTYNSYSSYYQLSDGIISDASFLRLKNLALSYQIPTTLKNKMHLRMARIYVQCQNLFTITNYLGLDPETKGLNLPPLSMVTAGLQIGL